MSAAASGLGTALLQVGAARVAGLTFPPEQPVLQTTWLFDARILA